MNGTMRALTVAPSLANSALIEDIPEPPLCAGSVKVRSLVLGLCATDREMLSGVHGWVPPAAKRRLIGHGSPGRVGGVSTPGRALSIDLGKHSAVAAPQQASKGWVGRLVIRCVPAEKWTQALAPEPHDVKVVDIS
jgi:D-arabinose 1-dehydrogenase-like Zn-dependent alcohol dehydrogenase